MKVYRDSLLEKVDCWNFESMGSSSIQVTRFFDAFSVPEDVRRIAATGLKQVTVMK